MFSSKYFAAIFILALLAPAGIPFANAQVSLGDVLPDGVWPAVPTDNAACDEYAATCEGIASTVDDVEGIHVDPADPDHTVEDVRHPVEDHALAGACVDAGACDTSPELPPLPSAITIVAPEQGDSSREGVVVTLIWSTDVAFDIRGGTLYRAQAKSDADGVWTDLPAHSCTPNPNSQTGLSGTCQTSWTPARGIYSLRVSMPAPVAGASTCDLNVNCAMITDYVVDGEAPTVGEPAVASADHTNGKINKLTPLVQVAASDDIALSKVTISASAPGRLPITCTAAKVGDTYECRLDSLAPLLAEPQYENVYQGAITLTATAADRVDNTATESTSVGVDTSGPGLVRVSPVGNIPTLVKNDERVSLTYKASYVLPINRAGDPAVGTFVVRDAGGNLCTGVIPASGVFACQVRATATQKVITADVVTADGTDSAPRTDELTWSVLDITRVNVEDAPRTSLHANPSETYEVAYRVTSTWDGVVHPVSGAILTLTPPGGMGGVDSTDADGNVRVGVVRAASGVVTFAADASYQILSATGDSSTITWSTIVMPALVVDDDFVNVGDTIAFSAVADARATYEHDLSQLVESATLALAPAFTADCALEGTIVDGIVSGTISCDEVFDGNIPVVVTSSTRGITTLAAAVNIPAVWTNVVISAPSLDDAFVNVDDVVTLTATATYAHNNAPVSTATISFGPGADADCSGTGGISAGALQFAATCAAVSDDASGTSLPLIVSTGSNDVTQLAAALSLDAIWTNIIVNDVAVDDDFVNVGDDVTLTAVVTYAHDGSAVSSAVLAFGPGASDDCTLVSGNVVDGALTAVAHCNVVSDAAGTVLPLVFATASEDVTQLTSEILLDAIWTNVVVTGLSVDDAFVNVGDDVTLSATARYAHDGSAVPSATVSLADGSAESCVGEGDISAGVLTVVANCAAVSAAEGTSLPFVISAGADDVTQLAVAQSLDAVWTNIVVTPLTLDDNLVNVDDVVSATAVATYAHNGANVGAATLVFGDTADDACVLNTGTIVDGAVDIEIQCSAVRNLTADGLPLVVSTGAGDVTQLAAPIAVKAIWTEIVVSYTYDETRNVLEPNAPVVFAATLLFAHDSSPLDDGVFIVKSVDGEEFLCVTDENGMCEVEVTKNLGEFEFSFEAFSTSNVGGVLSPDVRRMSDVPATKTYRWTSITFGDFMCTAKGVTAECGTTTYEVGTLVDVQVTVIAADNSEVLGGAVVKLAGATKTADSSGHASKDFTRFSAGPTTVVARGVSAQIGGETVSWTIPKSITLDFA